MNVKECKKCLIEKPFTTDYFKTTVVNNKEYMRKTCRECMSKHSKIYLSKVYSTEKNTIKFQKYRERRRQKILETTGSLPKVGRPKKVIA